MTAPVQNIEDTGKAGQGKPPTVGICNLQHRGKALDGLCFLRSARATNCPRFRGSISNPLKGPSCAGALAHKRPVCRGAHGTRKLRCQGASSAGNTRFARLAAYVCFRQLSFWAVCMFQVLRLYQKEIDGSAAMGYAGADQEGGREEPTALLVRRSCEGHHWNISLPPCRACRPRMEAKFLPGWDSTSRCWVVIVVVSVFSASPRRPLLPPLRGHPMFGVVGVVGLSGSFCASLPHTGHISEIAVLSLRGFCITPADALCRSARAHKLAPAFVELGWGGCLSTGPKGHGFLPQQNRRPAWEKLKWS